MKLGEDESVGRRGALQLKVQELELEQQPLSQKPKQEIQETPPDPDKETREGPSDCGDETRKAPSDPEEETQQAPPDPEQETREAQSDHEEETREASSDLNEEIQGAPSDSEGEKKKSVARLAAGLTDLGELIVPARRKLTISDRHVESTGARRRGRSSAAKNSVDDRRLQRGRR